ncbi:MAG: vWA domain-containing protein [Phycisphaerales bacterium]
MNRFEHPEFLWLLALVPALLILRRLLARRMRPAVVFSSLAHAGTLRGGTRRFFRWVPTFLRALALSSLIVALARPQFGTGQVKTTTNGVAMMIVVDRSASMNDPFSFQGQERSKIEVTREVVASFVEGDGKTLKGRPGDMIGLVTFAKYADTVCPLVRVHSTLVQLVRRIQLVGASMNEPEAGTAIGEGLALAAARLRDVERELKRRSESGEASRAEMRAAAEKNKGEPSEEKGSPSLPPGIRADDSFTLKSKAIVLLTDGEENMGEITALQAAELCRQWGIKVYAIGIGAGGNRGPVRQRLANGMVVMRMGGGFNDAVLKQIAEVTGGKYFPANDPESLVRVYQEIDALEKSETVTEEYTDYEEKFVLFAAAAGALLAFEALLGAFFLRRGP